jgi:hypothetical protein
MRAQIAAWVLEESNGVSAEWVPGRFPTGANDGYLLI